MIDPPKFDDLSVTHKDKIVGKVIETKLIEGGLGIEAKILIYPKYIEKVYKACGIKLTRKPDGSIIINAKVK